MTSVRTNPDKKADPTAEPEMLDVLISALFPQPEPSELTPQKRFKLLKEKGFKIADIAAAILPKEKLPRTYMKQTEFEKYQFIKEQRITVSIAETFYNQGKISKQELAEVKRLTKLYNETAVEKEELRYYKALRQALRQFLDQDAKKESDVAYYLRHQLEIRKKRNQRYKENKIKEIARKNGISIADARIVFKEGRGIKRDPVTRGWVFERWSDVVKRILENGVIKRIKAPK